jgi:signal transduction histidine kinase/CheY-like chemotaxis protein
MVRVANFVVAGFAAGFATLYAIDGPDQFVLPNLVAAVIFLGNALVVRDATRQVYLTVATALVLLGVQLALLGNVANGIIVWFVVPNVATLLIGIPRLAVLCVGMSVAEIVGVALAGTTGLLTPRAVIAHEDLVMAMSFVASLLLCALFARLMNVARRRLMLKLEDANAELRDALAAAESARAQAIEAAEAKDRFFANLTHEIRTPLNGIASTAELLAGTRLDEEQHLLADALGSSTTNLVALVNAMLDHARLRAGQVSAEPVPVEVRGAAANLELLFRAQAADRGLALSVAVADDVPPWILVDAIKMRQIMGNLVGNAIKFTNAGFVRVTVGLDPGPVQDADPMLVLVVADSGVGIPPDKAETVFDAFVQGDESISRTYGGTGLGLAIGRQLAGVLGGTLTHEARPGGGSVFTVAVPCRPTDAPVGVASPPREPEAPRPGIRVLLAEDNEVNRTVGARMLERLDAQVVIAEDGAQAAELATTGTFDLVLMDLQMPRLDGIEATRIIRNYEKSRGAAEVTIVAMTGNDPADYGEACAAAGMNGFLMKPVGLTELRGLLAGLGAGSRA